MSAIAAGVEGVRSGRELARIHPSRVGHPASVRSSLARAAGEPEFQVGSQKRRTVPSHGHRPLPDVQLRPCVPAPDAARRRERRPTAAHRRSDARSSAAVRHRLRRLLVGLLAATWIPGLLGAAVGASALRSWSVVSVYLGLSRALPGLLAGLIVLRAARGRASRLRRLAGLAAGCASAARSLLKAVAIIIALADDHRLVGRPLRASSAPDGFRGAEPPHRSRARGGVRS